MTLLPLDPIAACFTEPNPEQALLTILGPQDILVTAPAGCGKTEALARRAAALIAGGAVRQPRKLLALTFSNKAKENLAARFRSELGSSFRSRVTITNFHGLAARLVRAHGSAIGLAEGIAFPERGWRARVLHEVCPRERVARTEATLRAAKADPRTDDDVWRSILESGVEEAIEFETRLRADQRMDFDDLLRYGERLLLIPAVRELYRQHFAVVLVDEVQDLTRTQLRLVKLVGEGRLTAVGDPTQGIFGFVGADPDHVFASLAADRPALIRFNRSYRSAPRVLDLVSLMSTQVGGDALQCANPESWPTEGEVLILQAPTLRDEAVGLLDKVHALMETDPNIRIGIIVRRRGRRMTIEEEAVRRHLDYEAWDVPTHNAKTMALLRGHVGPILATLGDPSEHVHELETRCLADLDVDDLDGRDDVIGACAALGDLVEGGMELSDALRLCRRAPPIDAPLAPGLHLLNAHIGKGQQFDWVFVVGMEKGHIPDFRATSDAELREELRVLHVMASRARLGVVFTVVERTQNKYGGWFTEEPSPWLALVESVATGNLPERVREGG